MFKNDTNLTGDRQIEGRMSYRLIVKLVYTFKI